MISFYVGYIGKLWSGGAFPCEAKTPEQAAAKTYAHAASGFPKGDNIIACRMTARDMSAAYHLDLVGDDPTKPEAWRLDEAQSYRRSKS